jgi:hypothetical protein
VNRTLRALALATIPAMAGLASALPALATADGHFTVTIRNVSTDATLKLPDGSAVKAPIAPGAYAVIESGAPPFAVGQPAGTGGLESLAEDGNAEPLIASLKTRPGVREAGVFLPGQPFEVTARPGDKLVFLSMFVQSNDLFYAPRSGVIALYRGDGKPVSGDLTSEVALWDAGTEVNEQPGVGPNQAPREKAPNTGPDEHGTVGPVKDGFAYPAPDQVIDLSIAAD